MVWVYVGIGVLAAAIGFTAYAALLAGAEADREMEGWDYAECAGDIGMAERLRELRPSDRWVCPIKGALITDRECRQKRLQGSACAGCPHDKEVA